MARYVIGSNVTIGGVPYYRDQVAELTSAQASAVTSAGRTLRSASVVTASAGSPTHDTAGKVTGVSNSA